MSERSFNLVEKFAHLARRRGLGMPIILMPLGIKNTVKPSVDIAINALSLDAQSASMEIRADEPLRCQ